MIKGRCLEVFMGDTKESYRIIDDVRKYLVIYFNNKKLNHGSSVNVGNLGQIMYILCLVIGLFSLSLLVCYSYVFLFMV